MNPTHDNPSRIDERLLDLLVDDELAEQQRGEFLLGLDDTEDGWRRCALAFLEAQCLGRELGSISCVRPTDSRAEKRFGGAAANAKHWRMLLAMSASFLVALGLGISWRSPFVPDGSLGSPSVEVADSVLPAHAAVLDEYPKNAATAVADTVDNPRANSDSWRLVSFPVSDGTDEVDIVQLPAVERDSIDQAWLMNLPRAIPPEVVRAIEDSGHRVRGQRRLMPLRMKDGRRLVVPVDQVEVQYVGTPAYY